MSNGRERLREARPSPQTRVSHQARAQGVSFNVTQHVVQVHIRLDQEILEPPLIEMPMTGGPVMLMMSPNMHIHRALHVRRKITALAGPQDQMKVIRHEAHRQDPHRHLVEGLAKNVHECGVILGFVEDRLATIAAIQDVMNRVVR